MSNILCFNCATRKIVAYYVYNLLFNGLLFKRLTCEHCLGSAIENVSDTLTRKEKRNG